MTRTELLCKCGEYDQLCGAVIAVFRKHGMKYTVSCAFQYEPICLFLLDKFAPYHLVHFVITKCEGIVDPVFEAEFLCYEYAQKLDTQPVECLEKLKGIPEYVYLENYATKLTLDCTNNFMHINIEALDHYLTLTEQYIDKLYIAKEISEITSSQKNLELACTRLLLEKYRSTCYRRTCR